MSRFYSYVDDYLIMTGALNARALANKSIKLLLIIAHIRVNLPPLFTKLILLKGQIHLENAVANNEKREVEGCWCVVMMSHSKINMERWRDTLFCCCRDVIAGRPF